MPLDFSSVRDLLQELWEAAARDGDPDRMDVIGDVIDRFNARFGGE